jgi:hypothetical protein
MTRGRVGIIGAVTVAVLVGGFLLARYKNRKEES